MKEDPRRLGPWLFAVSVFGSSLLILMGAIFAYDHADAARAYGVGLSGGPDNSWITSAALRDLAFGGLALSFALLRDKRAMGLCLLFGAIIPAGDAVVVLQNSLTPWEFLPLHLGGAIACLVLAAILLLPRKASCRDQA